MSILDVRPLPAMTEQCGCIASFEAPAVAALKCIGASRDAERQLKLSGIRMNDVTRNTA